MEVSLAGSREGPHWLRSNGTSEKDKRQDMIVVSAAFTASELKSADQLGNIYPLVVTGNARVCCAVAA